MAKRDDAASWSLHDLDDSDNNQGVLLDVEPRPGFSPEALSSADIPVIDLRTQFVAPSSRSIFMTSLVRRGWVAGLGSFLLFVVATAVIAAIARPTSVDAVATTLAPSPRAAAPVAEPVTTTATATTTSTTTAAPTTTTSVAPTTVPPYIEPIGDSYEVAILTLHRDGVGPLRIGDPIDVVLGTLAASLGQPNSDSGLVTSVGEYGTCRGTQTRTVRWGSLTTVFQNQADLGPLFFGYRIEGQPAGTDDPAAGLKTVSGLEVGHTVATLVNVYSNAYTVSIANNLADGAEYEIRLGSIVLLRGPLSSTDGDGVVEGIYSPYRCTR